MRSAVGGLVLPACPVDDRRRSRQGPGGRDAIAWPPGRDSAGGTIVHAVEILASQRQWAIPTGGARQRTYAVRSRYFVRRRTGSSRAHHGDARGAESRRQRPCAGVGGMVTARWHRRPVLAHGRSRCRGRAGLSPPAWRTLQALARCSASAERSTRVTAPDERSGHRWSVVHREARKSFSRRGASPLRN